MQKFVRLPGGDSKPSRLRSHLLRVSDRDTAGGVEIDVIALDKVGRAALDPQRLGSCVAGSLSYQDST